MLRATISLLLLTLLSANTARAAEISGYVVGTTDYVYRGASQSNEHPAIQAGLDVGFQSGVFLGAWASTVDFESSFEQSRDTELRLYAGYGFDLNDQLRMVINTVAYRYPGSDGVVDYDNHETSLSLGLVDRFWIEYAYSPNLYNTRIDSHNIELFSEWPLNNSYLLSAGIGHFRVDRPSIASTAEISNDTLHWQIGLTRSFSRVDVDLRYHDAADAVWFTSTPDSIGSRLSLSLRLGF